jgi:hypothetical protein
MSFTAELTTSKMFAAFEEGIVARGGRVADVFDDGKRLFVRSVLPHAEDVRQGDTMHSGVAMKATDREVCVYPYTFRLVCRNGAIVAQTLDSRRLADIDVMTTDTVLETIREVVEACCSQESFSASIREMRRSGSVQVDHSLALMPLLSRFSASRGPDLMRLILQNLFRDGDRTRFGLANAVTAVARDIKDPELRWDLEEYGGGIAVGRVPTRPVGGRRTAAARANRLVEIGN